MTNLRFPVHSVVAVALFGTGIVCAQEFPSKPFRIVAGGVGGVSDTVARIVADGLREASGQPAVVENRSVGTGELVAKAPPDGYTLLVFGNSFWTQPLLRKTEYDPVRDFAPVTLAVNSASMLVVHPSLPVKTVKDLIALAKAKPGSLNYAATTVGGPLHLGGELFNSLAGTNIVHVPYKSPAAATISLLTGEVHVMFSSAVQSMPQVAAGKLRALGLTDAEGSAAFPGFPTIAASGLPGYDMSAPQAVFAPAKTPAPVIARLNQDIVRALNRPETKDRLLKSGVDVVGSPPDRVTAMLKSEVATWSKVIKDRGIKVE